MEQLMTVKDVAEYMRLSEQTIQRYVLNREIPFHKVKKVIRFRFSEIEKWIDGGGLGGGVKPGPEDGRENDLFACPDAAEAGAAGTEAETAVEDGDDTGGEA
jgi:excisionase family DNA binding protein